MPLVSNYSEWVIPEIEWINGESFLYKGALRSGQLDELSSEFNLYLHEVGVSKIITEGLDADSITCSPSGKRCLNGYTFEEVIEVESGDRRNWIEFDNEKHPLQVSAGDVFCLPILINVELPDILRKQA